MALKAFTAESVKSLPIPEKGEKWYREGQGFAVRCRSNGSRTYFLVYTIQAKKRYVTLGQVGEISLARARMEAKALRARVKTGEDPQFERQELAKLSALERSQTDGTLTFAELTESYIRDWCQRNKKSWKEDQRILNTYFSPTLANVRITEIVKGDISKLLAKIRERGKTTQENRALACVRAMFNWAVSQDHLDSNPCIGLKANKEKSRDRVLSDDEIRTLWSGLENPSFHVAIANLLKLQLLLGLRVGEACSLQWSDINGDWLTIPADRTKNGREHRILLTSDSQKIIHSTPKDSIGQYIFSAKGNDKPLNPDSVQKALTRAINREEIKLSPFRTHDLRRTFGTRLAKLSIKREVIDRALNHIDNSVHAVYNRHDFDQELAQALICWQSELFAMVDEKLCCKTGDTQKNNVRFLNFNSSKETSNETLKRKK